LTRKLTTLFFVVLAAALAVPVAGIADPAGKSTLQETIAPSATPGFFPLQAGPGEPFITRTSKLGKPGKSRASKRKSLLFFGQFTDPQISDEMSPTRLDFLDEAGSPLQDGVRPQDTLSTQQFDQVIRNMNANATSAVKPGSGKTAKLQFVVNTGDLADSQQANETGWVVNLLDGGTVDPFSGKPITDANCKGQSAETLARVNADVAARRYTGLQDYSDYTAPDIRKQAFWDPDEAPPAGAGPYAAFPRYPGLLDRAQQAFQAPGVNVPWYTARGNHDGLVTGNVYATFKLARALVTGCQKIFPSDKYDPTIYKGKTVSEIFDDIVNNPQRQQQLLTSTVTVAQDPARHYVDQREYKKLHDTGDHGHGYGYVDKTELKKSKGVASYYAFSPKKGFEFVSLDTVAEGGSLNGNVDDPQYKWLEKVLDKNSSTEWKGNKLVHDKDKDNLIVLYSHHKIEDLTATQADEAAGACTSDVDPGCDRDPRKSTPMHLGNKGKLTIRDLLLKYPNVISFVTGHTHRNEVKSFDKKGKTGFWQINTASHADFPQQAREIEVMDNKDGTLSLFNTVIDSAAPIAAPPFGAPASVFTEAQLASIGRLVAANDPQGLGPAGPDSRKNEGRGKATDRNVELPIRDPRRL
jgi:metallophosphoesterase (TIGR03767 family)